MNLRFAELHTPLFFAGINMGSKLDPTKRTGLVLTYDRVERELVVQYSGRTCIIPRENVASMEEVEAKKPVKVVK